MGHSLSISVLNVWKDSNELRPSFCSQGVYIVVKKIDNKQLKGYLFEGKISKICLWSRCGEQERAGGREEGKEEGEREKRSRMNSRCFDLSNQVNGSTDF